MIYEWLIILLLSIVFIVIFINFFNENVTYVVSDIDNNSYLVRNVDDKQLAANMLAKIKENIEMITNHLYKNINNYPDYVPYIIQLHKRIKNVIIVESSENSVYTSYSINKGEQIVFCLRSKLIKNSLHDMNLIMYVVLHEISHVACPTIGHDDTFKKIFAFITNIAIELNLYKKINFKENPLEYCGLTITDSII